MPKVIDINHEIILSEEIHETIYLINAGAEGGRADVNAVNNDRWTPLMLSTSSDQTKLLIDAVMISMP